MITQAQKDAKARYNKKTYDQILIRIKKEDHIKLNEILKKENISKNSFVLSAIFEKIAEMEKQQNKIKKDIVKDIEG